MNQYKVLVTSIGGDVGQSVCKALRFSGHAIKILGTDCTNFMPFPLFCDNFTVVPAAEDINYKAFITKLVEEYSIDLIYICSEQELFYISDHITAFPPEFCLRLVIPPLHVINICRDKLKTVEFLKRNCLPYAPSKICDQSTSTDELLQGFNYPLVVKKISDCGSKNLNIVNSRKEFTEINGLDSSYMLQDYIPGVEYTNGVYRDIISKEIYVISLERALKNGVSHTVKVVFDKEIKELCTEVAGKLNLNGSINIQLRKQAGCEPVIFEINPRYSSTSFMRAKFGFNDVIYAFENMVLKKSITPPHIKSGEACRYLDEYYLFH